MKLSDLVVLGLFKKFQAHFLSRWTSPIAGIEKIAMHEWAETLAGISPEQMSKGLRNLTMKWPPSPHEFRELCEGEYEPTVLSSHKETRSDRLLESDERKAEKKVIAKDAVSTMRNVLVGRKSNG